MSTPSDVLDSIFHRLASRCVLLDLNISGRRRLIYRSDETRNQAAEDLRVQVTSHTQEFQGHDGSTHIWGDIFHRTFDLTRSNTLYERLGATKAIGMVALALRHSC